MRPELPIWRPQLFVPATAAAQISKAGIGDGMSASETFRSLMQSSVGRGAAFMLLSIFLFACVDAIGKLLTVHIHPLQVGWDPPARDCSSRTLSDRVARTRCLANKSPGTSNRSGSSGGGRLHVHIFRTSARAPRGCDDNVQNLSHFRI